MSEATSARDTAEAARIGRAPLDAGGALDFGLRARIERPTEAAPLAPAIEETWLDPRGRLAPTWIEQEDIDAVSLAASLVPEGFLGA